MPSTRWQGLALIDGNAYQMVIQFYDVAAVHLLRLGTYVILKVIDMMVACA
jgi:hypothetical protein